MAISQAILSSIIPRAAAHQDEAIVMRIHEHKANTDAEIINMATGFSDSHSIAGIGMAVSNFDGKTAAEADTSMYTVAAGVGAAI